MSDNDSLDRLEVEVVEEIELARSGEPAAAEAVAPPSEWLYDPADAVREEVELSSLLGAVGALELDGTSEARDEPL